MLKQKLLFLMLSREKDKAGFNAFIQILKSH
jgi:hypothetical protein